MGRPRLFDEREAVAAACRVFWTKGFDGTTTEDLCEATGLGRSSIYNTFKSKPHLFRRSLEYYVDTMTDRQISVLRDETVDAPERIRRLLGVIIDGELANRRDGYGAGCFTVNTITGLASKDVLVAETLDRDLQRRLDSLRSLLAVGKADGSITSPLDAHGLAWYVVSVIYGMRVSAQSGADEPVLRQIADATLAALIC
jgi:AcrR family transcriptional regulator